MSNPILDQGMLNRIRGSVSFVNFPSLNVTAPYLGREGIRLALEGGATAQLPTMTGIVQSPEPYQMVTVTMALIKSQAFADQYKQQFETQTQLGDMTVRPDSTVLGAYGLTNAALEAVEGLDFSGNSPNFTVRIRATYIINAVLWN